jgi:Na+/proline symporter
MSETQQTYWGRVTVTVVVGLALIFATIVPGAIVMLGAFATSYGFMMYPALIAVCYWKFLTRQGVVTGLICGMLAVLVTFRFDFGLRWGNSPLTFHAAGWGILFNLPIAILVSLFTQPTASKRQSKRNGTVSLNNMPACPRIGNRWSNGAGSLPWSGLCLPSARAV